jgi:DNA-directed RNA polymerase subunit RPC12/RpoP
MKKEFKNLQTFEQHSDDIKKTESDIPKIEVTCHECGKKFKTTQAWFDSRNKDGNLQCRKCRFSKFPPKKEKPLEEEPEK